MRDIANFLFEVGMLTKTPRTGFRFTGIVAASYPTGHRTGYAIG